MFYCKSGDLLVVKPVYGPGARKVVLYIENAPYTTAILSSTKAHTNIPENEIVLALEASVPPFFVSDMIKCLWRETVVHIRRTHLEHVSKNVEKNRKENNG